MDVLVSAMHRYAVNVYKDAPNPAALTEIARLFLDVNKKSPFVCALPLLIGLLISFTTLLTQSKTNYRVAVGLIFPALRITPLTPSV